MFGFYVRSSLKLILLLGFLSTVMSALGSTQPIHPSLRGFVQGCAGIPQPCWYGIVPGVTTPAEAELNLVLHGFVLHQRDEYQFWLNPAWGEVNLVVDRNYGARLASVYLRPSAFITLQDVLGVLPSLPTHVGRNCNDGYSLPIGQIMLRTTGATPTSEVKTFELASFGVGGTLLFPHNRWRGFWHRYHITGGAGCG